MLTSFRIGLYRVFNWIDELQQRRALAELRRLDDRLLAEIGLSRREIEHMIRKEGSGHGAARRELIAKSSHGIMASEPRFLLSRPLRCRILAAVVLLSALLSAGLVVAAV
jgi:uncharacterized protein YjiS (DUF1127 family)